MPYGDDNETGRRECGPAPPGNHRFREECYDKKNDSFLSQDEIDALLCEIPEKEVSQEMNNEANMEKLPKPRDLMAHLDRHVIGQSHAKKTLAVAVYNHYKRLAATGIAGCMKIQKSNVLMVGPSGVGKTLLAKTLAEFIDVPFSIADSTALTETGYVGDDVESILSPLLKGSDDAQKAERGIVYIDEIDKIARRSDVPATGMDVSGRGVQQGLLKLIEGTVTHVPKWGTRKYSNTEVVQMDTSNILFICGGAFAGIEDIIGKRLGNDKMGFRSHPGRSLLEEDENILTKVSPRDLRDYGLIPELIGRLPIVTALDPLDATALMRIMIEPEDSLVDQYKKLFELDGVELSFSTSALLEIARRAIAQGTGARGLRSILEDLMLDLMFESPSNKNIRRIVIDRDFLDCRNGFRKISEPEGDKLKLAV